MTDRIYVQDVLLIPNSQSVARQLLQWQCHSNLDLTSIYYENLRVSDYSEHVLKVYKADQNLRYKRYKGNERDTAKTLKRTH